MGYHRAGFEVVGVDREPQPNYPFEFHLADAFEFVVEHGGEFDVVHASPPCQAYTGFRRVTESRFGSAPEHLDLVDEVRVALERTGRMWIIENVQGSPVRTGIIICGAALGLEHLARHRHFESSVLLFAPKCRHRENEYTIGVYGARPDGRRVSYRHHRLCRVARSLEEARVVMGIDWMEWDEITQAVPPVYTKYIGEQLMRALENGTG